jgi:outer membrane protein assembly factor BamB
MSSAEKTATTGTRGRERQRWFPALVLAAAAGWWIWQASYARYQTFTHFLVALVTVALISLWYVRCGGAPRRFRVWTVGALWFGLVLFFVLFRPVFNGDMGIFSWRLRFGRDADQFLKQLGSAGQAHDWQTTPHDYPRFLGTGYWAEVKGVELETNWEAHPPQEVWRREIGAGWSAFSVVGNYAVTQEQRGDQELVTCYRVDTGEPVWSHADKARFDPADVQGSLGGIGPRATPTLHDGKVLTQGGTGIVNCLDARTGAVLWSHDTAEKFGAPVVVWGKAGSPLMVDDMVVISVGAGDPDSSLVAFDIETGEVRWAAGKRQASYASPVLATLAGERQIIVVNERYVTGHGASDGIVLWEHPWAGPGDGNASASQPVPLDGDRVFLSKGYGVGSSLIAIKRDAAGKFSSEPLWNPPIKRVMKTKLCNVVVRDGFIYGLDDVLLECIEAETGAVRWKKRRNPEFGHGQIMLIGDVILVLSESGELALVKASPERYNELASMQVLDDANITWNNPAFAPPYLLVRNGREAACYRLPLKQAQLLAN